MGQLHAESGRWAMVAAKHNWELGKATGCLALVAFKDNWDLAAASANLALAVAEGSSYI
jgi:hypothetical protein